MSCSCEHQWRSLNVGPNELRLNVTLMSGQTFSWSESKIENENICIYCDEINNNIIYTACLNYHVIQLKETSNDVLYRAFSPSSSSQDNNNDDITYMKIYNYLLYYFYLNNKELYSISILRYDWEKKDSRMKQLIDTYPGLRLVRQDPVECLFTFICSSNNNINRITSLINILRNYGEFIYELNGTQYRSFPTIDVIAKISIETLRKLKFGYRSSYIYNSANLLLNKNEKWLINLSSPNCSPDDASEALQILPGVGRKVADCVCLYSLGHISKVPIDSHIAQVAIRVYKQPGTSSSLTMQQYHRFSDFFRELWGDNAGWAQCFAFCGELKAKPVKKAKQKRHSNKSIEREIIKKKKKKY